MPSPLQKDGVDKLQHVLAYGVITFLFLISLRTSPTMLSALLLFLAVSVIGAFDELTQLFVNRTASVTDLVADIVGILFVLFFSAMRRRQFLRPKP
jgi:VanZ family protein